MGVPGGGAAAAAGDFGADDREDGCVLRGAGCCAGACRRPSTDATQDGLRLRLMARWTLRFHFFFSFFLRPFRYNIAYILREGFYSKVGGGSLLPRSIITHDAPRPALFCARPSVRPSVERASDRESGVGVPCTTNA